MGHSKITVEHLPPCDFCGRVARFDGRTKHRGCWAYMCEGCFAIHGVGLGLGYGQELILAFGIEKALDEISYRPGGIICQ